MIRFSSLLCGVAVGSMVSLKCLNYFDYRPQLSARNAALQSAKNLDLTLVQVFFRHGARTPMKLIPGLEETVWDKNELRKELEHTRLRYELQNLKEGGLPPETTIPHKELRGGCLMGQMTTVGQQQVFDLGNELKKLYIDNLKFLGDTFDPNIIFLRTTNVERAIESLRCVVAGMFTNIKEPVTFWTLPIAEEFLFPNWQTCASLREYIKYCFRTGYRLPSYNEDLEKFSKMVGQPVPRRTFIDIYDDLNCRRAHNKAYPDNIKKFMKTIETHALHQFSESFLSPPHWTKGLVLPLSSSEMLKTVRENIISKINKENEYKLYLYSAHDSTLITLFSVFDIKLENWPPFAAYISLELYENKVGEQFVRMLYCGNVVKFKKFNKELLSLSQFKAIVTPLILDDVEKACNAKFEIPPH